MQRLDKELTTRGLVNSRSQAENLISLGYVKVDDRVVTKPAFLVSQNHQIKIDQSNQYVSRAALKLKSASKKLGLQFKGKVMLDVGSSTGGFTDFALKDGAVKSIAVDVGSDQLHPSLRSDPRIELYEKTDIRNLSKDITSQVDVAVIDVSFISILEVLPAVKSLLQKPNSQVVAMVKPQFEAGSALKNRGVIKNDTLRRKILKDFEDKIKRDFVIINKADSEISGKKGNTERFYLLSSI